MSKLYQNSLEGFLYEGVGTGEIRFLIEGTLNGLASWNNQTKRWEWDKYTGSAWRHNQVDDTGEWTSLPFSSSGTLLGGARIKGVAISPYTSGTGERELYILEHCTDLRTTIQIGDQTEKLNLKILSRQMREGFMYFEVDDVLLPAGLQAAVDVYFKYSGSDYRGYTCYSGSGQDIILNVYPFVPPVESEEYNPITNNVISNVEGTTARLVESFDLRNVLIGSEEDAETVYNGWYAPWNSIAEPPQYSQSLDEDSASTGSFPPGIVSRPTGGGVTANAGGALGIYQVLPTVYLEKATGWASIPDSFYTSIANGSGRWLGTKNAEYHTYLGDKLKFTAENIDECKKDIQQNADKGNYLVSQGSPFILQSEDTGSVSMDITGTIQGIALRNSSIKGELEGEIHGEISGYVTGIKLAKNEVTHYSSSVKIPNLEIYTKNKVGIQGKGTILNNNWERTGLVVTGSSMSLEGMTSFAGQCRFVDTTASNQEVKVRFQTASGDLYSLGTITGSGEIRYPGSQEQESSRQNLSDSNYFYFQNGNIERLLVSEILSGNLRIIPTEQVYISGTVGNVSKGISLHKFTGTLNLENNTIQAVNFEYADEDGVVLSNVETAEQSAVVFDSFTADAISISPDFSGKAGFVLTNGQIDVSTDGTTYVSLITQDQQTGLGTGSEATGSLPNGISRFMATSQIVATGSLPLPSWGFTKVRDTIVSEKSESSEEFRRADLAEGTAIISGSFEDFTLQGTRKSLRAFKFMKLLGSKIPQSDTQQAVQMLSELETGLSYARAAKQRGTVETSSMTPRIVSKAIMPQRVYDAIVTASLYKVPGVTGSVWTGSLPDRDLDFYGDDTGSINYFISESENTVNRLSDFLSGSKIDTYYREQSGQYTYVYLDCTGTNYLKADIRDFSGSYVKLVGTPGSQGSGLLSGSYRQIWGRFGDGTIIREQSTIPILGIRQDRINQILQAEYPIGVQKIRRTPGVSGVIYGAFDFAGYVDGGYEGNMVEGIIEGDMSGLVSGIVETGSIQGGPVQVTGVSRGSFTGTVTAGSLEGAMKNITVTGNNLTNNLLLEGQIEGVEEFPLEGLLTGSVNQVVLSGECRYTLTGSAFGGQELKVHIPEEGMMTGDVNISGEDWEGETTASVVLDLTGDNIGIEGYFAGSLSGSLVFGTSGKLFLPERVSSDSPEFSTSESILSGQFELSGSIKVSTSEDSSFSGGISAIPVDQSVSGTFDVTVGYSTDINVNITGSLDEFRGHALTRGLINVKSGTQGNLVEGHDRPFFTLRTFSGSIFPEDTTVEAVQNMNISDMVIESLGFTSGMSLVQYSTGSFGKIKEHEYVKNTLTLPQIGDIVYSSREGRSRVVSSKLYCPDLNALLTINDRGTVISEDYLAQVQ